MNYTQQLQLYSQHSINEFMEIIKFSTDRTARALGANNMLYHDNVTLKSNLELRELELQGAYAWNKELESQLREAVDEKNKALEANKELAKKLKETELKLMESCSDYMSLNFNYKYDHKVLQATTAELETTKRALQAAKQRYPPKHNGIEVEKMLKVAEDTLHTLEKYQKEKRDYGLLTASIVCKYKEAVESLTKNRDVLILGNGEKMQKITELEENLKEIKEEKENLAKRFAGSLETIKELKKYRKSLSNEIDMLTNANSGLTDTLNQLQNLRNQDADKMKTLEALLQANEAQMNAFLHDFQT